MSTHPLCTTCHERPSKALKGGPCSRCYQAERRGPPTRRADVVPLPQGRVSAAAQARYEAEAKRRKVSVYELVSETLERGPAGG